MSYLEWKWNFLEDLKNLICIIYKSKLIILLKINFLYSVYMFVLGIRFIFYTKIVDVYCLYVVAILLKLYFYVSILPPFTSIASTSP